MEIPVNFEDNKSSNLFLRKATSLFTPYFKFMTTPAKDGENNKVVLGVLSSPDSSSIGM